MPRFLYARARGPVLGVDTPTFAANLAAGTLIGTLTDPFAGQGLGATGFASFGTVPGQLALSGSTIVAGASGATAGTNYAIGVMATSGDGRRRVGETLSLGATAATVVASGATWKVAGSRGEVSYGTGGVSNSGLERIQSRARHYLGKGTYSALKFVDVGYWIAQSSVETPLANARTLMRAVEIPGAPVPVVAVKWSGATSVSIPGGATWVESDPLYPSDFGLSAFAAGTVIWLRPLEDTAAGGTILQQTTTGTGTPTGEGAVRSAVTADQHLAQGALTTGTGVISYTQLAMPLAILGLSANHGPSVLSIGDSIAYGQGETTQGAGDGSAGGGFVRRGLYAAGLPFVSVARSGTTAQAYLANSTARAMLYPYVSHALVEYGTNDMAAGRTSAQLLADLRAIYGQLRAAGVGRVEQTVIVPRVTNANLTAPESQSPVARFADGDSGGRRDFNLAIAASVGSGGPDAMIDTSSAVQDAGYADRWGVDAGPAARTVDGVHPNAAGHAGMAVPLAARLSRWI